MKLFTTRKALVVTLLAALLNIAACSTDQVIDNSVGVAAGTTKVVAKGAVGAGKLAVKGVRKAAGSDG
ncbi:hypothetical protein [Roseobacter litoralis]|uniref:Lipoprotein n=1 Tax=Roseobacter litoralis (strain ATCC 49566 / DSM 6996 / JCM 21268 / NBRC 15278 / OCh 149) TaxID=391595 RepID=F7ZAH2_ROSLO|nr:hypothetical protein [Roseobacter litoralis]AEI92972.1 hypothetical protein RLO149_c009580 [Roseobacter litoralis Och 149]